jgi:hypothetical protein
VGAELLRETPLCGNGIGPIGLLVLRTGGCQGEWFLSFGNRTSKTPGWLVQDRTTSVIM